MKKKFLSIIIVCSTGAIATAQVGVNNSTPKATLDVTAKNRNTSTAEGLIAPRLTGDQIKAVDGQYTASQKGISLYTTAVVSKPNPKTSAITAEGYSCFDGNVWQKLRTNIYTVGNGLNSAGNDVNLGVTHIQPTAIFNNGDSLKIQGSSSSTILDYYGYAEIGTVTPTAKLEIHNGNTPDALKITDGNTDNAKILVSDANGLATWKDTTGSALVINSTAGYSVSLTGSKLYTRAYVYVPTNGYYINSTRLISDKNVVVATYYDRII